MTTTRTTGALEIYEQYPMEDGDAVILLDDTVCLELEQPGRAPDRTLLDGLVHALRTSASVVVLAVARTGRRPRPADLLLWTELCAALADSGAQLRPLVLLPATGPDEPNPAVHPSAGARSRRA